MSSLSSTGPSATGIVSGLLSTTVASETATSASAARTSPTTLATMTTSTRRTTTTSTYTRFSILTSVTRSTTGCSSDIYKGRDGGFTAWDPDFGSTYDRSATSCQPSAVSSWYDQAPATTIPTALGSSSGTWFSCPYAYSTVTPPEPTATTNTVISASRSTDPNLVLCCPSGYFYNTTATISDYRPGYFPSQCYSLVAAGETLRYRTLNGASVTAESTVIPPDVTLVVQGIPVNGFTGTRSSATSPATSSGSAPSTSSSNSSRTSPQQLALILGLTFGLLFALAVCVGITRRQKRRLDRDMPTHVEASRPLQPTPTVTEQRRDHGRYGARDSHEEEPPPPYSK